jgi:hypothetical protein
VMTTLLKECHGNMLLPPFQNISLLKRFIFRNGGSSFCIATHMWLKTCLTHLEVYTYSYVPYFRHETLKTLKLVLTKNLKKMNLFFIEVLHISVHKTSVHAGVHHTLIAAVFI